MGDGGIVLGGWGGIGCEEGEERVNRSKRRRYGLRIGLKKRGGNFSSC